MSHNNNNLLLVTCSYSYRVIKWKTRETRFKVDEKRKTVFVANSYNFTRSISIQYGLKFVMQIENTSKFVCCVYDSISDKT
jgi:hypothetical protein